MAALLAYYTGDTVAATVPDESGNGFDASGTNLAQGAAPAGVPGGGNAFDFAASGAILSVPLAALPAGDFAISFWLTWNGVAQAATYGCPLRFDAGGNEFELEYHSGTGAWTFGDYGSAGVSAISGAALVVINYTRDYDEYSDRCEIYIDDAATPTSYGQLDLGMTALRFGPGYDTGAPAYDWRSLIDEIAIWDAHLDASARAALLAGGVTFPPAPVVVSFGFRLTLTGAADATTDVVLPVNNITARLRSGSPSYLSVTVPYSDARAAAISDRPNGDLRLDHVAYDSQGNEIITEVVTVAFEVPQPSRGTRNSSIVLVGHRQSTNSNPGSHTVAAKSFQTGGYDHVAVAPGFNPAIKPADQLTTEGKTITIGTVVLQALITRTTFSVETQFIEG